MWDARSPATAPHPPHTPKPTFCSVRSLRPSGSHFITPCRDFIQLTLPRSVLISPASAAQPPVQPNISHVIGSSGWRSATNDRMPSTPGVQAAAAGAPLWPSMRMGWARCQEGKVLVEKRECTRAI